MIRRICGVSFWVELTVAHSRSQSLAVVAFSYPHEKCRLSHNVAHIQHLNFVCWDNIFLLNHIFCLRRGRRGGLRLSLLCSDADPRCCEHRKPARHIYVPMKVVRCQWIHNDTHTTREVSKPRKKGQGLVSGGRGNPTRIAFIYLLCNFFVAVSTSPRLVNKRIGCLSADGGDLLRIFFSVA